MRLVYLCNWRIVGGNRCASLACFPVPLTRPYVAAYTVCVAVYRFICAHIQYHVRSRSRTQQNGKSERSCRETISTERYWTRQKRPQPIDDTTQSTAAQIVLSAPALTHKRDKRTPRRKRPDTGGKSNRIIVNTCAHLKRKSTFQFKSRLRASVCVCVCVY